MAQCCNGDDNLVVIVVAQITPLAFQQTDNLEWYAVNPYSFTDGICVGEQLVCYCLSDHHNSCGGANIAIEVGKDLLLFGNSSITAQALENASGQATGWAAWSPEKARHARLRYGQHQERLAREAQEENARLAGQASDAASPPPEKGTPQPPPATDGKQAAIAAALARARARRPA